MNTKSSKKRENTAVYGRSPHSEQSFRKRFNHTPRARTAHTHTTHTPPQQNCLNQPLRKRAETDQKTTTNKPAPKITTVSVPVKQTRTPTTVGALAVRASKFTSRATAPPVTRTFVKPVTISPPVSNLTGGRIAQNQGGDLGYDNRLLFGTTKSGESTDSE